MRALEEIGQAPDDVEQDLLLLLERNVAHLQHEWRALAQVLFFEQRPEDRKVARTGEVHPIKALHVGRQVLQQWQQLALTPLQRLCQAHMLRGRFVPLRVFQAQHGGIPTYATLDQGQRQVRAAALAGHAVQLFGCRVAIEAVNVRDPSVLFFLDVRDTTAHAHAMIQTLGHRLAEGAAEQMALTLPGADLFYQLVESVLCSIMGADHMDLTTPDQQGKRCLQQLGQILVERRLINHHHTLTAPQVARATG
ncbi:hypothetical protein D3C79_792100 [compost metagenome]